MRAQLAGLLVALAALTGCAGMAPDYHVRIDHMDGAEGAGWGHGILIDSHHVVTVEHVAEDKDVVYHVSRAGLHGEITKRIRYVKARLIGKAYVGASAEPLSVLRLEKGMVCDRYPKFRQIAPGDSGSPILGRNGDVVGLVSGYANRMWWLGKIRRMPIVGTNGPIGPIPRTFQEKENK